MTPNYINSLFISPGAQTVFPLFFLLLKQASDFSLQGLTPTESEHVSFPAYLDFAFSYRSCSFPLAESFLKFRKPK